ncbi:MAG: hypothetical protein FD180_1526 [Planctomycetota bacterium]|nr:MAG: hypothetical protein FD180_1526 [Planctomycetota bacterium]
MTRHLFAFPKSARRALLGLGAVFALLLVTSLAEAADPLVGVPTTATADSSFNDEDSSATYGSGKYLLAWTSAGGGTSGGDVYARFVSADASSMDAVFAVAIGTGPVKTPRTAWVSAGGGTFAIAHRDHDNLVLRRFNSAGTFLGGITVNNPATTNRFSAFDIATDGVNRICVVWTGWLEGTDVQETWAEIRDFAGVLVKDDSKIAAASAGNLDHHRPAVVWNATLAEWAFAWEEFDVAAGTAPMIEAIAWDATLGAATTPEIAVSSTTGADADLAWNLLANEYLVVWHQLVSGAVADVFARSLAADDGSPTGAEFSVESDPGISQDAAVAYSPGGNRYLVCFERKSGSERGAYAQVLAGDGSPIGDIFALSDGVMERETETALARNSDSGEFLATWTEKVGSVQHIWKGRLDVVPPVAPDGLTATADADSILLSWTLGAETDLDFYRVFRSTTSGGVYAEIAIVDAPATGPVVYDDSNVIANLQYYYVVRAVDLREDQSADSPEATAMIDTISTGADHPLLAPPGSIGYEAPNIAGSSTPFQVIGTQGTAQAYQCVGKVNFGQLRVENQFGILNWNYTGIKWGSTVGMWNSPPTQFNQKVATTDRGNGVFDFVTAVDEGFHSEIFIQASGGAGDITLSGQLTTQLGIERIFGGDSTATSFQTDGQVVLVNQLGLRCFAIDTIRVMDLNDSIIYCTVDWVQVPGGFTFSIVVPGGWLATAVYPIRVEPLIGVPVAVSPESGSKDSESAVAFGSGQYFAVWTAAASSTLAVAVISPTTSNDLYARRVAPDGTLIGTTFAIATGSADQRFARVAYASGSGGVFAVAHKDGNFVVLKRYNAAGVLLSTSTVNDPVLNNRVTTVDIASNGTDRFCITWTGYMATDTFRQTWAEVRNVDGSVMTGDTVVGPASGTLIHSLPTVVWNAALSHWMFVWDEQDGAFAAAPKQVEGRAFDATLSAPAFPETLISTPAGSNFEARAAWSATSGEYLVVFTNIPPTGPTNVHGRRVSAIGGSLLGGDFLVEANIRGSTAAAVQWVPTSNRWLVGFELAGSGTRGTYGQVLKSDGTGVGPLFVFSDGADFAEMQMALARNPADDQYLATWTDGTTAVQDIWAARLEVTPPAAPGPITTSNDASSITLSWPKGSESDLSSYLVGKSLTPGGPYSFSFSSIVIPPPGPTVRWTDTFVSPNLRYYYVVFARDTHANVSDASAEASEIIDTIPPASPTGLAATPGDTLVDLTWTPNTEPDLAGYDAWYRPAGGTDWTKANVTLIGTPAFTVTGLTNGVAYEFAVSAVDTEPNSSALSLPVTATPVDSESPATPTGLVATGGNESVTLVWDANAETDLKQYNVYRFDEGTSTYVKIASVLAGTLTYLDGGLTNGTTYSYKLSAEDLSLNESALSAAVSATPKTPAPTGLTHTGSTYNSISLLWSPVSGASSYNLWRAATPGGPYASVSASPIVTTTYTDTGLSSGTYYYVVSAVPATGDESGYSGEIAAATTPVPAPDLSPANVRKTNADKPLVTGTSMEGWTVQLWEDATLLGEGVAGVGGSFSFPTTISLSEGPHDIRASATVPVPGSPTSVLSPPVVITIDTTPPSPPTGLTFAAGETWVDLQWKENTEADLLGYNVYRRIIEPEAVWEKLNDKPLLDPRYIDKSVSIPNTYEYRVTALDDALDEK